MADAEPPSSPVFKQPGSPAGAPWSSFHTSLKLSTRVPGTPVRQSDPSVVPSLTPQRLLPKGPSAPPAIVQEFKQHFTTLDFLIE